MRYASIVIALALMLVPFISSAEYYKYKDESGVLRYTDDLNEIPKDQRPNMDAYSEPADFITPEQEQQKVEDAEAKRVKEKDAMRVKLDNTKIALDKEYEELKKAKQDLIDARADAIKNAADTKAHQEKVLQLNERIKDFQNRRQAFAKEVDAYNAPQGE
jgi:hypothetical protein